MNVSIKDAMGKIFFTLMSAFAELEADLLSERMKKGQKQHEQEDEKVEDLHYQITKNVKLKFYMMNKNLQAKKLQN